jgi:oligopeptide/dipeptide ABC transporter ATP-binding protein
VVMYAGRVVEEGPTEDVFANPKHPYTWSLLQSIPRLDAEEHEALRAIEGLPPDLTDLPSGCAFHPRCPFRVERCLEQTPALEWVGRTQRAACWVTQGGAELSSVPPQEIRTPGYPQRSEEGGAPRFPGDPGVAAGREGGETGA